MVADDPEGRRPRALDHQETAMTNFEIPSEMRQMAEQSVQQAKKAVDGFIAAAQQAVGTLEGQAAAAQAGAGSGSAAGIAQTGAGSGCA